jgi:glutaredoxin 3
MLEILRNRLFGVAPVTATQGIVMYSTRFCPYCMRAKGLLSSKGLEFTEIAVDGNHELRTEMIQKSGRHTVPQIWIGEKHIGGCDELYQLERSGQLDQLVAGENNE